MEQLIIFVVCFLGYLFLGALTMEGIRKLSSEEVPVLAGLLWPITWCTISLMLVIGILRFMFYGK